MPPPVDRLARPWVLVPVFVVVSLVGGAFPSFSLGANLLVLGAGAALCWLGLSPRLTRRPPPRRLSARAAWWVVPAVIFAAIEIGDFVLGSTAAHPTLSTLADPLLNRYAVRALAYLGWLSAFWALVRR